MQRKKLFLYVLFVFSAFVLVISALSLRRNFQDSWILEGLLPQTIFFVLSFLFLAVNVNSNRRLVLLISSFFVLLAAITALKYVEIYGVFDSIAHSGYANRLVSLGHVPETGFYSKEYAGTPGFHIFLASIALVSGFSISSAIKILLLLFSFLGPLIVYFLIVRYVNKEKSRIILLSLCISAPVFVSLTGTVFGSIFYFFLIAIFLNFLLIRPRREFVLVFVIIGIGLIISHGISSMFLTLLFPTTLLVGSIFEYFQKRLHDFSRQSPVFSNYLFVSLFFIGALMSWYIFNAFSHLNFIVNTLISFFETTPAVGIPSKFFNLNIYQQIPLLFVRFYELFIAAGLSLLGFLLFLKKYRKNAPKKTKFVFRHVFYLLFAVILIAIPFTSRFEIYTLERFYVYIVFLLPLFMGISLSFFIGRLKRIGNKRVYRDSILFLVLVIIVVPGLFSRFPFQPILPVTAEGDFVVDYRSANSVYQIAMINFAHINYVSGTVASDTVTSWQIFGLTDVTFFEGFSWVNPLLEDYSETNFLLLHYSGRAGPLNEPVENRTRLALDNIKLSIGNNVIYDNGESFVVHR